MQTNGISPPVRVVVDAMGGDYGPPETVKGAIEAVIDAGIKSGSIEIILVGDQGPIEAELANYNVAGRPITIVPSVGKIGDDEHPIHGLRHKPEASILVATRLLKAGEGDVLISMGSTGASMASSVMVLGLMEGLERPCIGGPFLGLAPRTVMVDMGSNVDCRPALLLSFAALGAGFAKKFLGIKNPRIGLLSVGAEEAKGNRQVQESYHLFQQSHLNFVGNVEGMDFFTDKADVVVCDGFVGNILMKFTEGLGGVLGQYLKKQLGPALSEQKAGSIVSQLWTEMNLPRKMGGPLFGVNGTVVLGHGSSRSDGIAGAIDTAVRCVDLDLVGGMRRELAEIYRSGALKVG
jgi:glycerol-3-phosphate acyltransferase PlsX